MAGIELIGVVASPSPHFDVKPRSHYEPEEKIDKSSLRMAGRHQRQGLGGQSAGGQFAGSDGKRDGRCSLVQAKFMERGSC
jgi:hypothetical protein